MCLCSNSDLYDYTIANLKQDHKCSSDWIMTYGCYVSQPSVFENPLMLVSYQPARYIRAFTVGEAQRLIEYENGVVNRRPIHRVLELKDNKWEEIVPCSLVKSETQLARERAIYKEFFGE